MRGISTTEIASGMPAEGALVNVILNTSLSLTGTTQNTARCFGFEDVVVDEVAFGYLEGASREAVILVWIEKGLGLVVVGLG
jgi:hypothetical protein